MSTDASCILSDQDTLRLIDALSETDSPRLRNALHLHLSNSTNLQDLSAKFLQQTYITSYVLPRHTSSWCSPKFIDKAHGRVLHSLKALNKGSIVLVEKPLIQAPIRETMTSTQSCHHCLKFVGTLDDQFQRAASFRNPTKSIKSFPHFTPTHAQSSSTPSIPFLLEFLKECDATHLIAARLICSFINKINRQLPYMYWAKKPFSSFVNCAEKRNDKTLEKKEHKSDDDDLFDISEYMDDSSDSSEDEFPLEQNLMTQTHILKLNDLAFRRVHKETYTNRSIIPFLIAGTETTFPIAHTFRMSPFLSFIDLISIVTCNATWYGHQNPIDEYILSASTETCKKSGKRQDSVSPASLGYTANHSALVPLDSLPKSMGLALFLIQSNANHSCQPNTEIVLSKGELSLTLQNAVQADEELCISYLNENEQALPVCLKESEAGP
ncbi:hypothetical protein BLNAU_12237 [Blattamonas nauphoetae]|uniref:SET domain-containing protein n=1 Tax=Blattamonas nauphoetae TaxID=2049346 RepID=A0ABQ9XMM7_9EUKA|nr:hypothetical protein BLNAU_12237 [Blattamonas nauphoetae]